MEEFKTSINNHYKDSLFRMVFANPDHRDLTLSLYNAISGSDLKNPDELEFTTIDNVLYMGRKNDLSFIVADELVVAEHQSTRCGNMPVRMLIYAAMVYSKLIHRKGMSPYGNKTIALPVPKLVCLYNGAEDMEERSIRSLSEAFPPGSEPDIHAEVLMLNINRGKNSAMLGSCAALASYSLLLYQQVVKAMHSGRVFSNPKLKLHWRGPLTDFYSLVLSRTSKWLSVIPPLQCSL